MKSMLKKIIAAAIAAGLFSTGLTAFAAPSFDIASASDTAPQISHSMVTVQEGMRAVTIVAGADFGVEQTSAAELSAELSALMSDIAAFEMNAVIIDASAYQFDEDVLSLALEAAHDAGFFAYIKLDVAVLVSEVCEAGGGLKNGFAAHAHKFVMRYPCEGIILSDYYTSDNEQMFCEYMKSGSGIGYTNWLYETNEYIIRTLSEVIRRTNNTVAVGMLISDMWANRTTEGGSDTNDTIEALYDGFCDTKKYAEKGYVDMLLVQGYGSTSDAALNFRKVTQWWYDLAENCGAKLYMLHMNEKIGSGWYEDELLRQLAVLEDYENAGGSAFTSFSSLKKDPLGSTKTLISYFEKKINTDTIFEDLKMTSPTSTSFITYDPSVKFMGTFDENFDVFFDGSKIKLNEAGNFYFQKDLQVGKNTFTFEHKGKTTKYSIERRVDVLKSIENEKNLTVDGGTKLTLVAVAYSGAKVSATIGGKTINLKEKEGSSEELDANGSYAKFVGYYTCAEGIIGEVQELGSISFYAKYYGSEEYMTGGTVTIEAKPEPPKQIAAEIIPNQDSVGSGEVVGTMPPVVTDSETIKYIKVLSNYTTVYDGRTTGDMPSPIFSQLPAGTLDYYKSESDGYITTTSGKRFRSGDVTTFTDTGLGYNALLVKSIGNINGKSFIKLHMDYKASFNITAPVDYKEDLDGAFGVAYYNAPTVYITFDNITSVTSLPKFDYCSLFSSGIWETVEENGVPKFRLALTLRQAGLFSGCGAYYDENGDLMLTFAVPTATLSGKTIVIDPGHGYGKVPDKLDPGGIGNVTEQSVNLAVSKLLEQKLSAMGANVVRLKTESEFILTNTRPVVARSYGADMYLSLHCNSVLNPDAHGVEVYYFTSFSQPLASAINDNIVAYYDYTVYADGTSSSRGAKYSYYWVTLQQDFPSVLIEMGFVTNERECMVLANPEHQSGIADAIANGVYSYFARSGLSYSGSGSDNTDTPTVPDVPEEPNEPSIPVTPGQPEDTAEGDDPETTDVPLESETTDETSEPQDPGETGGGIRVE